MLDSVTPSQSVSITSIAGQQQVLNIPEKDEIWSSILKDVAATKVVPTKNVLILGNSSIFVLFYLISHFSKKVNLVWVNQP